MTPICAVRPGTSSVQPLVAEPSLLKPAVRSFIAIDVYMISLCPTIDNHWPVSQINKKLAPPLPPIWESSPQIFRPHEVRRARGEYSLVYKSTNSKGALADPGGNPATLSHFPPLADPEGDVGLQSPSCSPSPIFGRLCKMGRPPRLNLPLTVAASPFLIPISLSEKEKRSASGALHPRP